MVRVLIVDVSVGFGGSIHSLAEIVTGFEKISSPPVEFCVVTYQLPKAVEGLFSGALARYNLGRLLDYRTRWAFNRWVERWGILRRPLQKIYAAADSLNDHILYRELRRLLIRHRIDVVHLNNGSARFGVRAADALGLPLVTHVRGLSSKPSSDPWHSQVSRRLPPTHYIAVSSHMAELAKKRGVRPDRLTTIHNSVDLDKFDSAVGRRERVRQCLGVHDGDLLVGVFGRVTKWKGQLELLEACGQVMAEKTNVHLVVVGDSSDTDPNYMRRLEVRATEPPFEGRVHVVGYQRDVAAYYHAVDIVVHCSVEPEPFGRVVIEGMACGKPVIAVAEGGPLDIITPEEDGILVKPRDVPDMARAIMCLSESAELRSRLGVAARATVQGRFTTDLITRKLHELYMRLME